MACPGFCWSILWLLALIFVGYPVGFLLAWLYVFLLPFSACIDPVKDVCEALLKLVRLPYTFAEYMMQGKPCCS